MTRYVVQYVLPVDNPVSNVAMRRTKMGTFFEVPLNHPDAHSMGYCDLIAAAELSGLITVSPGLNKNRVASEVKTVVSSRGK